MPRRWEGIEFVVITKHYSQPTAATSQVSKSYLAPNIARQLEACSNGPGTGWREASGPSWFCHSCF